MKKVKWVQKLQFSLLSSRWPPSASCMSLFVIILLHAATKRHLYIQYNQKIPKILVINHINHFDFNKYKDKVDFWTR